MYLNSRDRVVDVSVIPRSRTYRMPGRMGGQAPPRWYTYTYIRASDCAGNTAALFCIDLHNG